MEEENNVQVLTNVYGDVCIRKARRKRRRLLATELLYDYSEKTTLHGIPYLTKKGLTQTEKIFWLLTVLISISWCFVLIYQLWIRWRTSPVIVTISEQVVPVSMVPFPAVTICPQLKSKASVYNFTKEYPEMRRIYDDELYLNSSSYLEELKELADMMKICAIGDIGYFTEDSMSHDSIIDQIHKVSPDFNDVFEECLWQGVNLDCNDLFTTVLTHEGLCYTMNTLANDEIFRTEIIKNSHSYINFTKKIQGWSNEDGYSDVKAKDSYPRHGSEQGAKADLIVNLKENISDHDDLCNPYYSGFKVFISHPSNLPQSSKYYYAVLNNQVSSIALSFSILNTSQSLISYDSEVRQCYFPKDRYLKYFNNYTANNCWIECLSNHTFLRCKCVDFYMPHNSSPICSWEQRQCMHDAHEELLEIERSSSANNCHCLPACVSVDYEAEILKTEYKLNNVYAAIDNINNSTFWGSYYQGINFSRLEVFFKKPRFLSMRRSELFGTTEFLANCGGLMGLFMGFSFLSLVELFYFLTLRLWCTFKKDLEEEKAQAIKEKPPQD